MTRTEALPSISMPIAPTFTDGAGLSMLIQVPFVTGGARQDGHLERLPRPSLQTRGIRRTRRRLRREFRFAAIAVFALLPLPLALGVTRWPSRTASAHVLEIPSGEGSVSDAVPSAPIWLSVEPAGSSSEGEGDAPVSLPGYLLPDDVHEEPAHAGS